MITPVRRTDRIGQPRWSFQHVGLSGRASVHGWIGNTFRIFNRVAHPETDREKERGRESEKEKKTGRGRQRKRAHMRGCEAKRKRERERKGEGEKETKTEGEWRSDTSRHRAHSTRSVHTARTCSGWDRIG